MPVRYVLWGCWIVFLVYWVVTARGAKAVQERQNLAEEWTWRGPLLLGAVLLIFAPFPAPDRALVPGSAHWVWTGAGLTVLGLLIAIWARRTLGGNWGSAVSLKQDHELIQAGPYRWVRNPIYTGLILMFLGTALVIGRASSLLALLLAIAAYWIKLKQEERVMARQFPEAYAAYRREVKALIPFVL